MKKIIKLILFLLLSISLSFGLTDYIAQARGSGGGHSGYKSSGTGYKSTSVKGYTRKDGTYVAPHYRSSSSSESKSYKSDAPSSVVGIKRDSEGHIERSSSAKKEFLKSKGYDNTPKGYEVDHKVPLYKGGADEPSNMQLLPKEVHKEKTRIDLKKD